MVSFYSIPIVSAKRGDQPVDRDLALALTFWAIEEMREKGGGFFRKKEAERVTQIAVIYRPIMVTKYKSSLLAFDGCGITSAEFKYGIAPSLTYLRNYFISDSWESKPDSYVIGLDLQSQDFEQARDAYAHSLPGLITDPALLGNLSDLLELSSLSESRTDVLPQRLSFEAIGQSIEELDRLKRLLGREISPLKGLELELVEKTAQVLAPIKEEYARIENQYDRRISEIRPSVTSNKQKYEKQRAEDHEHIETRIDGQLRDLKERLIDAKGKIDSYEYDERTPRGGIEKQYSLRNNLEGRIEELENEKQTKISLINEKYDRLISEEQSRIDALEDSKQEALKEPKARIQTIQSATERLAKTVRGLARDHELFFSVAEHSNLVLPKQIEVDEFIACFPIIVTRFEKGYAARTEVSTVGILKESKGMMGRIKGIVGMKQSPLEKSNDSLSNFAKSAVEHPKVGPSVPPLVLRYDILQDPQTMALVSSGIAKMEALGWLKSKEAQEFQELVRSNFVSSHALRLPEEDHQQRHSQIEESTSHNPLVRFLSYKGVEAWVEISKLDDLRKSDEEEFSKGFPSSRSAISESSRLLRYLKSIRIPHNKQYCVEKKEDWVQNQLYIMLANSEYRARVNRERRFEVKEVESRIDFDVSGIGIEVKIFRSIQDFHRLATEMIHYTREYSEIIIPYINAGFTDERLNSEFRFLTEKFKELIGYFELNCGDI